MSFFKVGQTVNGAATAAEAINLAGLNWEVRTQPIFVEAGFDADGNTQFAVAEGLSGVVRQDNKATLGVVGGRYHSIQNTEAFDFIDGIIGGKAAFDTAGTFDGGKRVWMSVSMGDVEIANPHLAGDSVKKYLILSNTHDGSGTLQVFFSNIRVVCQNTLNMALRTAGKDGLKIRHTKSAKDRLAEAQRIMMANEQYQHEFVSLANGMAATSFTLDQMVALSKELMPAREDAKVSTRADNSREELVALFTSGKGNAGKTLWDAYNAVTEYSDHHRSTRVVEGRNSEEVRLQSNWFGSGFAFKQKGLDLIRDRVA